MSYALILCNGDPPERELAVFLSAGAAFIICADGGANTARTLGITPHCIIGDLDSIHPEVLLHYVDHSIPVIHRYGQDDTDFEKAIHYARSRGHSRLAVLGATGRMLDHTLGNLSIVRRHIAGGSITLFDSSFRIDAITASTDFSAHAGDRISILPFPDAENIEYEGLEFPLRNEALSFGHREGTCNSALNGRFTVRLKSGALLVFRVLHPDIWNIEE